MACYASSGPSVRTAELATEQWKKVIKDLAEAGASAVYFLGGEPTLRRDLQGLVGFSSDLGLFAAMSTNGFLIDREYALSLKRAGLQEVQLSIDSPKEPRNDYLRGPKSLSAALKAAEIFNGLGVRITVSTTVSDLNYMDVRGMLELAERIGAEAINFIAVQRFGRALASGLSLSASNARAVIKELLGYSGRLQVTANGFRFFLTLDEALKSGAAPAPCPAGESYLAVGPDGSIYGCDLLMVLGMVAGNALKDDVRKILEDGFVELKGRRRAEFAPCSRCPLKGVCQAGCPARALQAQGRLYSPDPLCGYWAGLR